MSEKQHLYWRTKGDSKFRPKHHSSYCWCSIGKANFRPRDLTAFAYYFWRPGPGPPPKGGPLRSDAVAHGHGGICETQGGHERSTKPEVLR